MEDVELSSEHEESTESVWDVLEHVNVVIESVECRTCDFFAVAIKNGASLNTAFITLSLFSIISRAIHEHTSLILSSKVLTRP